MAEEWWEKVVRKIREEREAAEAVTAKRLKHADMMVIALRHLDKLLNAGASSAMTTDPEALTSWVDAWDSATGFLDYCKKEGLL